jgi:hypothetical protein
VIARFWKNVNGGVIVGNVNVSGLIVIFKTVVAVAPRLSVAVIVTGVATKDDVGVPVRFPVDDENASP